MGFSVPLTVDRPNKDSQYSRHKGSYYEKAGSGSTAKNMAALVLDRKISISKTDRVKRRCFEASKDFLRKILGGISQIP